ncbi:MAG: dTDP-4-dehydrorhamnose reductase [Alphaproteobacteria bacterium]|nr:dTDP-4-dehydrorhamnose reductase [Alphaproteobacteria bacterium]
MTGKILITGANGQLGTELSRILPDAMLTNTKTLDITDWFAVKEFVSDNNIDTIINCAAYTAVDKAETDKDKAVAVNIIGPKNLAMTGAKLFHISTDYVFDGKNFCPYTPTDKASPVSVYGKTKYNGELAVLKNAKTSIIIRTAWLYSPYGNNFVKTMRRLGSEKEQINVVADQIGSPTYAADLAQAIINILPQIKDSQKGIYHFTNEGVCSWYDFASAIMEESNLNCQVNPIPSSAYPTKAQRPFYSVLDKSQTKQDFGLKIAHWKDGLRRCIQELDKTK